jgi:hypothetical protein
VAVLKEFYSVAKITQISTKNVTTGQAIRLIAARATFHLCNSRKQFEAGAVPKQGSQCARPEGQDRDLVQVPRARGRKNYPAAEDGFAPSCELKTCTLATTTGPGLIRGRLAARTRGLITA